MSHPGPLPAAQLDCRAASLTLHQRRVLEVLLEHPEGLDVTQLGRFTGVHANTVREHVAALERGGLVTTSVRHGGRRGRPSRTYVAQAAPPGAASAHMAALVRLLVESMDDDRAREIGRTWARGLLRTGRADARTTDPARELTRLLAETGFAPELRPGVIHLYRCPFMDEGGRLPAQTCEVHRGALEELMGAFGRSTAASDAGAVRLEPFGGPGACRVILAPAGPATTGNAPGLVAGSVRRDEEER